MISVIKNNIPIISALLIFTGYLNLHFYYTHFDIEINVFLTASELIFSFLPLTIPFLLTICFLILWSLGLHIVIVRQEKEKSPYETDDSTIDEIVSVPKAWKQLKFRVQKKKDWLDWVLMPVTIFTFLLSIVVQLFLIGYVYIILKNFISDEPYLSFGPTMFLGILWLFFIFSRLSIYKKEETKKRVRQFGFVLSVTVAVVLLWIGNKESAMNVLNGEPEYQVNFDFNSKPISTDSTLVFIGRTSEYLFLRDLPNSQNQIFRLDQINKLTQSKTKANRR